MGRLHDALQVDHVQESNSAGLECSEKEYPQVLLALAATFERLVSSNERCLEDVSKHNKLTIFHGIRPPNITISKYLERIHKYTDCSPSCFVVGFIYIDHLVHKQPDLPLISLNVHRLLITSIMVATKLLDDVHYNNAFYARVGGISTVELNSLEMDFLFRLDFRLQVTASMFEGYCTQLEREMLLAGEWIERTIPSAVIFSSEDQNSEKHNVLKDAQKKVKRSVNHNNTSIAFATALEPTESLNGLVDLQTSGLGS